MKGLSILLIVLGINSSAFSQPLPGDKYVGVSVANAYLDLSDLSDKYYNVNLMPEYGGFVTNKFLLGGGLSLGRWWRKGRFSRTRSNSIGLMLNMRYYILNKEITPFVGAGGSIGQSYFKGSYTNYGIVKGDELMRKFWGSFGLAYFANETICIEAVWKFNGSSLDPRTGESEDGDIEYFGISFDMGIKVFFGRENDERL